MTFKKDPNQAQKDIKRFWSKVQLNDDDICWNWLDERDKNGYGRIHLITIKARTAHRIAWILTYGEIPDGIQVCHHCDNPPCVNPKHLFLGTQSDNIKDMYSKGRGIPHSGELCCRAKLTNQQADEIRRLKRTGKYRHRELAKMFGVSETQISNIIHYINYKETQIL